MKRVGHSGLTTIVGCASAAAATATSILVQDPGVIWFAWATTAGVFCTLPIKIGRTTFYFNPDMDIRLNPTSKLARMTGIELYRKSVPHRAGMEADHWTGILTRPHEILFMSHLPFFGTIPRWLLLCFVPVVLILMSGQWWMLYWPFWIGILNGMSLSDTFHFIADRISTILRSMKKD